MLSHRQWLKAQEINVAHFSKPLSFLRHVHVTYAFCSFPLLSLHLLPAASANCPGIVVLLAGILISLTFVVRPELITELSMGFLERQIERNRGETNNEYHGRLGCGWACGRRVFTVSVSCFFFFTVFSNGVDTLRFPCSALNVKVVRNSKQVWTNDRRNHDSHNGSHVCSECQKCAKQVRVNGKSQMSRLLLT